jgi:phage/plasmid-like protein (TIGR03299 family)
MAHELETQNGVASFASFREPAWHGLGTVFTEEKTTSEMLAAANLNNWNVRLVDVEIPSTLTSDKSYQYVVRTNPTDNNQTDILGVVGERYHVLQNEDLFSFGDNILDGGGRWETAGSIKGGRVVFGSLALQRETVLDPSGVADKVKTYLLINTSHDGSIAIQASITPVRVVCANTLNLALGGKKKKNGIKQSFKIRHTQTANGKVQIARETLGLANAYWTNSTSWLRLCSRRKSMLNNSMILFLLLIQSLIKMLRVQSRSGKIKLMLSMTSIQANSMA